MRQGQLRRISAMLMGLAVAATLLQIAPATAASPPDFGALLRARPYLQLFTESNDCSAIRTANQLTGTQLDDRLTQLTKWFVHFHSEGSNNWPFGDNCKGTSSTTLAEKLAARGAIITNYRNGSYVSQANKGQVNWGEAEMMERVAPRSISTFWPGNHKPYVTGNDASTGGRLAASLNATATTLQVTALPGDAKPANTPAHWPFMASRGTGTNPGSYSKSTHDVVSWIRVDDELMQIVDTPTVSGGVVSLAVLRGLWGTGASSHAANARVMSPVYIGSTTAAASDSGLNGAPVRDDTNATLRYGLKIWQQPAWNFIADRIGATFKSPGLQGYNGVWLDVSSCNQYNNADWHGNPVFQWNDQAGTKFTRESWGQAQKTKLAGLRSRFPGVWFAGNSLGNNDACTWDLLGSTYDGGALEHYMKPGEFNFDWNKQIDQTFKIMGGNWPGLFWVRWNYAYSGNVAQYKRFAYGNTLLALRSTSDRYQFGGPFGLNQPDELFFWDFGAPVGTPSTAAETKVAGANLYRRDYANGTVLVNPTSSAITYQLGATMWDVVTKDAAGLPKAVTSVTVGAHDAAFLLRAGSDPAPAPAPTPMPSPTPTPTPSPTPTSANEAPDTELSAPAVDASLPADAPVVVQGLATDDAGVAEVSVGILDVATKQWWRAGGTWGARQEHAATVDSAGSAGTTWSFTWQPPSAGGTFEVHAWAKDDAGRIDETPAERRFQVAAAVEPTPTPTPTPTASPTPSPSPSPSPKDRRGPNTKIHPTHPRNARSVVGPLRRIVGSAVDDRGVAMVLVAVKDSRSGRWLQRDGGWGRVARWQHANVRNHGTWVFPWHVRGGSYRIVAQAVDLAGNEDRTPAVRFLRFR